MKKQKTNNMFYTEKLEIALKIERIYLGGKEHSPWSPFKRGIKKGELLGG